MKVGYLVTPVVDLLVLGIERMVGTVVGELCVAVVEGEYLVFGPE